MRPPTWQLFDLADAWFTMITLSALTQGESAGDGISRSSGKILANDERRLENVVSVGGPENPAVSKVDP